MLTGITLDNDLLVIRIFITTRDNYSEDIDFSLMQSDENFKLENYFESVISSSKKTRRFLMFYKSQVIVSSN